MSFGRLIFASLRYHWRVNTAVALGVAVAVAVLTGALLMGDSMRGSLRDLALDRLGRIDQVLVANRFFREDLADELAANDGFVNEFDQAVPVILLNGNLTNPANPDRPVRVNRVNLIGCDSRFWKLGPVEVDQVNATAGQLDTLPRGRQIILNGPLAKQLGLTVGDVVLVRLARPGTLPAETPLGRRDSIERIRLRVGAIIEPTGLGGFGLSLSQQSPRNAYIAIDVLQKQLGRPGQINTILVSTGRFDATSPQVDERLQAMLHPRLEDYGLHATQSSRGYLTLSTDRVIFSRPVESSLVRVLEVVRPNQPIQRALTYLANTIACGGREIPYSTITAVDWANTSPLGPLLDSDGKPVGPLGDNQIVLNSWAADDLGAKLGDTIRVTYFEPESLHGKLRESTAKFRLVAIVPLAGLAADRDFLPSVPGVTDQLTMDQWDPPFPFDPGRIRPKDEDYWENHRGTPKAFVSLAAGRKLWASRFGQTTTIRVADLTEPVAPTLAERLPAREMGFVCRPIRQQSLAASAGTTSFNLLFLGFSFFIIVSAVLLVVLLFRLGVHLRARQIGLLLAVGWTPRRIAQGLAAEGAVVAAGGSIFGTAIGIGYAALMLLGLQTWWLAAIVTPFLQLHCTRTGLIIGPAVGFVMSLAVIILAVWRIGRRSPQALLTGQSVERPATGFSRRHRARPLVFVLVLLLAATGLAVLLTRLGDEFQAGAFFGAGALVLIGLVMAVAWQWTAGARRPAIRLGRGSLLRLALLGAARHPLRSTLSVGLVATACFLIVSVSAFRIDPSGQPRLDSANGRFMLVAQSDLPIHDDLDTPEGRHALGISDEDNRQLDGCTILSFRVRPGDDASCLNLYGPRQPRLLGVPKTMIARGGFAWASAVDPKYPWRALVVSHHESNGAGITSDRSVPMVLERDTATYSLHLHGGLGATYDVEDDLNRPVPLRVVGQLRGSPFQGDLLISEEELLRHFPDTSGYRFFLIECPVEKTATVRAVLELALGDYGFAAEPMANYLAGFLAVPNTYLSTFQSLGGLGLLLGTFGLAVVQTRNVIERRRELALLRAVGLRRRQIAWLVMAENALLLIAGLACGVVAALVAVLPHLLSGDASIPWASLAGTLAVVLVVGLAAGLVAVRASVAAPLLETLREE
ncbi:MAG: FtsX-like permease family protein [Pirellulales bacterium]|nr:FtsX-like permease family protein [Pirellulales bacterium]